ncbi:hypothetical protein D3C71_1285060 [compost metagenome]
MYAANLHCAFTDELLPVVVHQFEERLRAAALLVPLHVLGLLIDGRVDEVEVNAAFFEFIAHDVVAGDQEHVNLRARLLNVHQVVVRELSLVERAAVAICNDQAVGVREHGRLADTRETTEHVVEPTICGERDAAYLADTRSRASRSFVILIFFLVLVGFVALFTTIVFAVVVFAFTIIGVFVFGIIVIANIVAVGIGVFALGVLRLLLGLVLLHLQFFGLALLLDLSQFFVRRQTLRDCTGTTIAVHIDVGFCGQWECDLHAAFLLAGFLSFDRRASVAADEARGNGVVV